VLQLPARVRERVGVGWHGIDSQASNPAEELTKIGGAKVIIATVTDGGAMAAVQGGLAFSSMTGVRSMNEVYSLEKVNEAYDHMMSGKARFRVVLTMGT